jgi:hypothetical protein
VKSSTVRLRSHDLRHHAITKLAESETSDQTIMSIAGHVSKKMLAAYARLAGAWGAVMAQTTAQIHSPQRFLVRKGLTRMVDVGGLEPPTSSLRTMRSPN